MQFVLIVANDGKYKRQVRSMLIKCPECGKEVSTKVVSCPCCGCPVGVIENDDVIFEDNDNIIYQGIKINLYEIVDIYGMSKAGAYNFLNRQYGISMESAKNIINQYYNKILNEKDNKLANKINMQIIRSNSDEIKNTENIRNHKTSHFGKAWNALVDIGTKDNSVKCPKCGSTSISYQNKKLSLGRAIVGDAVAGPAGAVLGGLSSKKGYAVCLKCGKQWKI